MPNRIQNIESLLEKLYRNIPDVYAKCEVKLPDKNGKTSIKRCIINMKTGDIFKNRKTACHESVNFIVARRFAHRGKKEIFHAAFQNAQIIDNQIVLTTWMFGDYINQPETSVIHPSWYSAIPIGDVKMGEVQSQNAIMNIVLAKPTLVAIATVNANKEVAEWDDVEKYGMIEDADSSGQYLADALVQALHSTYCASRVFGLTDCFKALFKISYIGANKYVSFDSHRDVPAFMKTAVTRKHRNKTTLIFEQLVSIGLPNHSTSEFDDHTICFADRANDEWTVLRWFMRDAPHVYFETSRLYVNKSDALRCRSDLHDGWIQETTKLKATTFNADRIILQTPSVLDGTKLEYFKKISTEMVNQSAALYMLTMYPEFEKMYKIGFEWLCNSYLQSRHQMSWKKYLEEYVGHIGWDSKNIFKMIGLNRHQVNEIGKWIDLQYKDLNERGYMENLWQLRMINSITMKLKSIFRLQALNDIDNATFDAILYSITLERLLGVYVSALKRTFELYPKNAMSFIRDLLSVIGDEDPIVRIPRENGYVARMSAIRLYSDTLRMVQSGGYVDVIRPRFSSLEELVNHHEVMVDLINADKINHEARQNQQYENGFKNNLERWKNWEWEGDNELCVIAPTSPLDLAIEGIELRHCVKSYIPSVSQGKTNIMFIRRKGKETEPFFTVEIDLTNRIRQIHGMCNCNVSSIDGLHEFVKKWAKLKKLKYSSTFANGVRAI